MYIFAVGRQKNSLSCDLEEILANATASEVLCGESQYALDDGTRVDARKRILLKSVPKILILHINRTWWERGVQKIQTHVRFPFELCVDPFRIHSSDQPNGNYLLKSVVSHHGHQMSGGHFTAVFDFFLLL